jgi:hypothetical protein
MAQARRTSLHVQNPRVRMAGPSLRSASRNTGTHRALRWHARHTHAVQTGRLETRRIWMRVEGVRA